LFAIDEKHMCEISRADMEAQVYPRIASSAFL
jgi:hypothetical protein